MSAYIVEKKHVLYLVDAARCRSIMGGAGAFRWYHGGTWHELGAWDEDRAADVANMLWRENLRSVGVRYDTQKTSAELPGAPADEFLILPEDIRPRWHTFDPVQVFKACHCFSYQASESDDWEETEAHAFIEALQSAAAHALPGYGDAAWGAPEETHAPGVVSLMSLVNRKRSK